MFEIINNIDKVNKSINYNNNYLTVSTQLIYAYTFLVLLFSASLSVTENCSILIEIVKLLATSTDLFTKGVF